ncbi:MAG: hypothetical protein WC506_04915 [Candidatus Micrarchaeia archaeon]
MALLVFTGALAAQNLSVRQFDFNSPSRPVSASLKFTDAEDGHGNMSYSFMGCTGQSCSFGLDFGDCSGKCSFGRVAGFDTQLLAVFADGGRGTSETFSLNGVDNDTVKYAVESSGTALYVSEETSPAWEIVYYIITMAITIVPSLIVASIAFLIMKKPKELLFKVALAVLVSSTFSYILSNLVSLPYPVLAEAALNVVLETVLIVYLAKGELGLWEAGIVSLAINAVLVVLMMMLALLTFLLGYLLL